MKILKAMTASVMLAALPLASHAEDMSYSNVDLGYVTTDIDGVGPSLDGFDVRGSIGFAEHYFAIRGVLERQSVSGVDLDQTAVGLGGHCGLSDNLDLVGRVGWFKAEVSGGGTSLDEDGYLVSAGLRGKVGDKVELEGGVNYTDSVDSGGDRPRSWSAVVISSPRPSRWVPSTSIATTRRPTWPAFASASKTSGLHVAAGNILPGRFFLRLHRASRASRPCAIVRP